MTFDDIKNSKFYSVFYKLPLVPEHNNPWIYCAYIFNLLKLAKIIEAFNERDVMRYYEACKVEPGLFHRAPGGVGGKTSHDELMGAAWLSETIAKEILDYLRRNDGYYNNQSLERNLKDNVKRFPWFMPFLKTCAGEKISLVEQLVWCGACYIDSLNTTHDMGGKLKFWLMGSRMTKYRTCAWILKLWEKRLKSNSVTLYELFKAELDYPELTTIAKEVTL